MRLSYVNIIFVRAGMSELADEADSKSVDGNIVWVQVPLPAYKRPQVSNRKSEVFLFAAHRFLKSSRRRCLTAVLSHHRAYRSVHGGFNS